MPKPRLLILYLLLLVCAQTNAQQDSTLESLQQLPLKYISSIDKKVDKYSKRITSKTIKTLEKLSHWETKIKSNLEKISPEAAQKLFSSGQLTFSSLLQQIKQGEATVLQYQQQYDKYRDDLTTGLKYIEQQKEMLDSSVLKKVTDTRKKMQELNEEEDRNEAIQQFIQQRKRELVNQAFQVLGKNKYLRKITAENFYYIETLKNYKQLFTDERKAEQTAKTILNKIPLFRKFMEDNSMFSSLFGRPEDVASAVNIAGLQTRASVQNLIQQQIAAGGPNAQQAINQNIQSAQAQINQLKDKLINKLKTGGGDIKELDFRPNMQRTRTFLQRIVTSSDFQFAKNSNLLPTVMEVALMLGYRLNDHSTAGVGLEYSIGLGSINHIQISHRGVGFRSFIDWRLKKQFFIAGGYELNHNAAFESFGQLKNYAAYQSSALLGITKKMAIKTKWTKGTTVQLLYDLLWNKKSPLGQKINLRIGYNF